MNREVHISLSVTRRIFTSVRICVISAQTKKQNMTKVQTPHPPPRHLSPRVTTVLIPKTTFAIFKQYEVLQYLFLKETIYF